MTAYDSNLSGTTELDETAVALFADMALYRASQELVVDQVCDIRQGVPGATFRWTFHENLSAITSALTEDNEADSVSMSDNAVTLTPAEYGNVITTTNLIQLQSGGIVNSSAAFLIGRNAGVSLDGLAIAAAKAFGLSANTIYPNDVTAAASVGEADIMDKAYAARLYNVLASANVPGVSGSDYIGVAHDDVLHDMRADAGTGSWTDVSKYANPQSVLMNEVGMFQGIRWLRSSNASATTDGGAGTVDIYPVMVFGYQALGKAESAPLQITVRGPFDKLGRFLHTGWLWVGVYDSINVYNQAFGYCASSVGSNT